MGLRLIWCLRSLPALCCISADGRRAGRSLHRKLYGERCRAARGEQRGASTAVSVYILCSRRFRLIRMRVGATRVAPNLSMDGSNNVSDRWRTRHCPMMTIGVFLHNVPLFTVTRTRLRIRRWDGNSERCLHGDEGSNVGQCHSLPLRFSKNSNFAKSYSYSVMIIAVTQRLRIRRLFHFRLCQDQVRVNRFCLALHCLSFLSFINPVTLRTS